MKRKIWIKRERERERSRERDQERDQEREIKREVKRDGGKKTNSNLLDSKSILSTPLEGRLTVLFQESI